MCFIEIAIASSVAATAIGTTSAAQSAKYQSKVNELNARQAEQQARNERALAGVDAAEAARAASFDLGAFDASAAATNFDPSVGDIPVQRSSVAATGSQNTALTLFRGASRASALEGQAANFRANASANRASIAPTILGGAFAGTGRVASLWYRYRTDQDLLKDRATPSYDIPWSLARP